MTRGRRPNLTLEPSRQLLVQRAFRERKAAHLRHLEESVQRLSQENKALRSAAHIHDEQDLSRLLEDVASQDDGDDEEEEGGEPRERRDGETDAQPKGSKRHKRQQQEQPEAHGKRGKAAKRKRASKAGASGVETKEEADASDELASQASSSGRKATAEMEKVKEPPCMRCLEHAHHREEISDAMSQVDFHLATLATSMVRLRSALGRSKDVAPSTEGTANVWPSMHSAPAGPLPSAPPVSPLALTMSATFGGPHRDEQQPLLSSLAGHTPSRRSAPRPLQLGAAAHHQSFGAPEVDVSVHSFGSMSGATQGLIETMRKGQLGSPTQPHAQQQQADAQAQHPQPPPPPTTTQATTGRARATKSQRRKKSEAAPQAAADANSNDPERSGVAAMPSAANSGAWPPPPPSKLTNVQTSPAASLQIATPALSFGTAATTTPAPSASTPSDRDVTGVAESTNHARRTFTSYDATGSGYAQPPPPGSLWDSRPGSVEAAAAAAVTATAAAGGGLPPGIHHPVMGPLIATGPSVPLSSRGAGLARTGGGGGSVGGGDGDEAMRRVDPRSDHSRGEQQQQPQLPPPPGVSTPHGGGGGYRFVQPRPHPELANPTLESEFGGAMPGVVGDGVVDGHAARVARPSSSAPPSNAGAATAVPPSSPQQGSSRRPSRTPNASHPPPPPPQQQPVHQPPDGAPAPTMATEPSGPSTGTRLGAGGPESVRVATPAAPPAPPQGTYEVAAMTARSLGLAQPSSCSAPEAQCCMGLFSCDSDGRILL